MTDHGDILRQIQEKLDKIDNKLDDFMCRLAIAETWIKGHSTILAFIGTLLLALLGFLLTGDL